MKSIKELELSLAQSNENLQENMVICSDIFVAFLNNDKEEYFEVKFNETISFRTIKKLVRLLEKIIENNKTNHICATAIWAIGKLCDRKYEGYFIKLLKEFRQSDYQSMYQTMIALDNINIKIFEDKSANLFDKEVNLNLVDKFLDKK